MRTFEKTYDPITGIWTTIGAQDGKLVIKSDGEVTQAMDHTLALRNSDEYSKAGIRKNWWHCFSIPPIIAMKMITDEGFDPYKQNARETFKFIKRHKDKYGHCLTTRGAF
jgi:hypothetical protein